MLRKGALIEKAAPIIKLLSNGGELIRKGAFIFGRNRVRTGHGKPGKSWNFRI